MKSSLATIIQIVFVLFLVASTFSTVTGQVDTCSDRVGGTFSNMWGSQDSRHTEFCNTPPADIQFNEGPGVITCHGCFPGAPDRAQSMAKLGSQSCTSYSQQMVIDFSEPVADLTVEVWGATTISNNRGETLHPTPKFSDWVTGPRVANFQGGGITQITISDPLVMDILNPDGTVLIPAFWEMFVNSMEWSPSSNYDQCSCSRATIAAPPTQNVSSSWQLDTNGVNPNWSMLVQMTPNDGLVLRDIRLGQRYMVDKISIPYFYLETSALAKTPSELKPHDPEA